MTFDAASSLARGTMRFDPGRGLVDQVFDQLSNEIMAGKYKAGETLPSERALAETLAVNRQVIREASRRLAQMGLVQVVHGDGTRVLDYKARGGLDLLALLVERQSAGKRSLAFWLPILELRCALAPEVVRHCTLRGKQSLRNELLATALKMSRSDDGEQFYALELRFWELLHEGADHLVYRFTYNSFKRCAEAAPEQSRAWALREAKHCGYRVELARAIAAGDAVRAEREIRSSMRAILEACEAELAKRKTARQEKPAVKPEVGSKPPTARTKPKSKTSAVKPADKTEPTRLKPRPAQSSLIAKPPPRKKASLV